MGDPVAVVVLMLLSFALGALLTYAFQNGFFGDTCLRARLQSPPLIPNESPGTMTGTLSSPGTGASAAHTV